MTQAILKTFERCQRRFPAVRLSIEAFQSRVDEILSLKMLPAGSAERAEAFAKIHHEDLYLAIACAHNDRVAWEHFADDCLPLLRKFAAQACSSAVEGEDLAQEIIAKLLNDKKRLAGYNGRGSLANWLRVAVAHAAVDRFRRAKKQTSLEELQENGNPAVLADPVRHDDEEALDSRWGPIISAIANECLGKLPARNRLLLCLYYLQSVPLKNIGRRFGISEATAYRWLDRMRREIKKRVERELRKKHGLRSSEMESLWKWISASSFAQSVRGSSTGMEMPPNESSGHFRKKSAINDNSGVISKKEELP
jgi:RNA polymerase sigma-70 factor, ECF subfamily